MWKETNNLVDPGKRSNLRDFSMPRLRSLILFAALILPFSGRSATTPVVLNVNYISTAPIHIGSQITVYMSAVEPGQSIAVSVTAYTSVDITLGGGGLTLLGAQTLFITDGIRSWSVFFPGGGSSTLTVSDGNLMMNAPPFNGADYT